MARKSTREILASAGIIIPPGVSIKSAEAQNAIAAHAGKSIEERKAAFAEHPDHFALAPDYHARAAEGRKSNCPASTEIANAMRQGWGVVSIAAEMLGVSASVILDRMRVNADIRAARVEGMRLGDDLWHRRAMEGIDAGNTQWAALYLKRRETEMEIASRGTIHGPRPASSGGGAAAGMLGGGGGGVAGAVGDLDRDVRSVRELTDAEIMKVMADWQASQAADGARVVEADVGEAAPACDVAGNAPPWDNSPDGADDEATDGAADPLFEQSEAK